MKILLPGSTCRTGRCLVRKALERGYDMHALVRDRNKLKADTRLKIIQGTPADPTVLAHAFFSSEAIFQNTEYHLAK